MRVALCSDKIELLSCLSSAHASLQLRNVQESQQPAHTVYVPGNGVLTCKWSMDASGCFSFHPFIKLLSRAAFRGRLRKSFSGAEP